MTSGRGRRPPASGRRSAVIGRAAVGALRPSGCSTTRSATRCTCSGRTGRLPELGVRPGAEHLEGPHGDVAARGRVAQLLRRRVRQHPRQDRRCWAATTASVYNTDIWEWDTTTGVWAQLMPAAGIGGPRRALLPHDRVRLDPARAAAGRRLPHVTGATGAANDSWEWDANLLRWNETTPPGVKPAAALPPPDGVQLRCAGRPTCSAARSPTTPTYGPSEFWEYLPNATARPNGAGLHRRRRRDACMSGNCVDGVCCAQTAAAVRRHVQVVQRRRQRRARAATSPPGCPTTPVRRTRRATPRQQCKKRLGQACNLFTECASGNCADGVCCDTACNDKCKQCNLAGKRGTCSFVPTGDEDPVGAPACVSDPDAGPLLRRRRQLQQPAKANGKPCTAGGQCTSGYCIDGVCCNSGCAQTCYQCDKPGAVGTCSVIAVGAAGPQRDHAVRQRRCSTATAPGTCVTNKKPNGETCTGGRRLRQRTSASTGSAAAAPARAPASRARCRARWAAASTCRPGAQDTNATTPCTGAQYCDAAGTCQTGAEAQRQRVRRGDRVRVEHVRRRCLLRRDLRRGLLHLQPAGRQRPASASGVPTRRDGRRARAPNYCDATHKCTSGKKPNGATCARRSASARSNVCVDGTCCESACSSGKCRSCKNATGHLHVRGRRDGPAQRLQGRAGSAAGTCNGQGACRWAPQGQSCRDGRAARPTSASSPSVGKLRRRRQLRGQDATDCNGFGCYTDPAGGWRSARRTARRDPDCAIDATARSTPTAAPLTPATAARIACPPAFQLGHACTRNTQCLSGTCAIRRQRSASAATSTATSAGRCDMPTRDLHPDPAGHASRRRAAGQRQRSDAACAAACATATRAAPIPPAGTHLRHLQGLQRRRPVQRQARRRQRPAGRSTATA